MRPQDFTDAKPGRLVKSPGGYWTYEPDPLPPPDSTLGLDFRLAKELAEAERAIGELAGVGRMLPNPHLLIRPFITVPSAATFLDQTYPAAQKNVARLVTADILREVAGTSSPKLFVDHEVLRLLDDPL